MLSSMREKRREEKGRERKRREGKGREEKRSMTYGVFWFGSRRLGGTLWLMDELSLFSSSMYT